jgi:hypothetical protein
MVIGRDWHGAAFNFDPFTLYAAGLLTNPNMLVVGQVGSGKSALVKTLLWRAIAFGYAAWVADPKGEYADLAASAGAPVIRLGPGEPARLNPLDAEQASRAGGSAGVEAATATTDSRVGLVAALASTALDRPLTPAEHAAIALALATVTRDAGDAAPVLPDLVEALLTPNGRSAAAVRMSTSRFADATRDLALMMRRMCTGDLAGMFDGPTHVPHVASSADADGQHQGGPLFDGDVPLVVLDLSAVYRGNRDALPLVMCAATAWLQAAIAGTATASQVTDPAVSVGNCARRFVVVDEAWALLNQEATARWLQASFKLARAFGVANIAVLHRFSDLSAAGAAGSETAALAQGLLADVGTRVVYNQPASEVPEARRALGLTDPEAGLLPHLPRGTALWKVGARSWLVEHHRSDAERAMTDTDHAMRGTSGAAGPVVEPPKVVSRNGARP